jgi:molybdopterin converting factor small subunit
VPPLLRSHTAGQRVVDADGTTVEEILRDLCTNYPGVADALYEEDGQLRRFVNLYLNDEDIRYLAQTDTPVQDGDTVAILPALAGG